MIGRHHGPLPSIAFPHDSYGHMLNILLLSDIHGNFPALAAIEQFFADEHFDLILNGGDSVVYAPFPSETLRWLRQHQAISILGNTDKKVIRLLQGKPLNKPRNIDKRIMYTSTAGQLDEEGRNDLFAMPAYLDLQLAVGDSGPVGRTVGLHHGSPGRTARVPLCRYPERALCRTRRRQPFRDHRHRSFPYPLPQADRRHPLHQPRLGRPDVRRRSAGQLRRAPPVRRCGRGRAFPHRLRHRDGDQGPGRLSAPGDLRQDVPGGKKTQLSNCTFRRKSATVATIPRPTRPRRHPTPIDSSTT